MAKAIVVGAGLAGLTAALNLARRGHEVTLLEKFANVGGFPAVRPAVDATPMDREKLSAFVGIDLREPMVTQANRNVLYLYGKKYDMTISKLVEMYVVERGTRKTALDYHIYSLCLEAGVKFEFNHPIKNQSEMADLPPDTIIATGLYVDPFDSLGLSYDMCYGYIGLGKVPSEKNNMVAGWFGKLTEDYAYIATVNDVVFGLFFQRRPVTEAQRDVWLDQLARDEGITFPKILPHTGPVPTSLTNRPRLFSGNKILAGTISGMMEPGLLFGVHGALVSGKIAAIAFEDKAQAYNLFQEYNRFFTGALLWKKLIDKAPEVMKTSLMRASAHIIEHLPSGFSRRHQKNVLRAIPGYGQLP